MDMIHIMLSASQTYATGEAAVSMAALGNVLEKVMDGEALNLSVVDDFVDWR